MSNSSISQASLQSLNPSYDHVEDIHAALQEMKDSMPDEDPEQIIIWCEERSNRLRAALGIPVAQENDDSIHEPEEEVCEQYNVHIEDGDESLECEEEDIFDHDDNPLGHEEDALGFERDGFCYEEATFDLEESSYSYDDAYSYDGDSFDY